MQKTPQTVQAAEVEVKNVSKHFGAQKVLKDVSLRMNRSETFVIMGPSGSGKSVLLNSMIGLIKPDSGQILIDGLDASQRSTHKKIVTSLVFQAGALFNSLNVYDNLAFYPTEHRLYSKKVLKEKVEHTLEILSLQNAAKKMPSELSGGMRKRVAIARALMVEPQLLLYDEPTSELDPVMSATISEIIATLKDEFQVTSIVVSHDRDLAMTIADHLAIIHEGHIHVVGTPQEVAASEDPTVQEFLNPKIDTYNPRFKNSKHIHA